MTTDQALEKVRRSRVDHKKEWYVEQLAIERIRAHKAECRVRELESQGFWKRLFWRAGK